MQVTPPIPPQAADNPSNSAESGQKKSAYDKDTIAAPSPQAMSEKTSPQSPPSPNVRQPVSISELPPVSVKKDWMDKASWWFGAILAVVGIVGILAAYRTLKAIESQTHVLSESQRPRIVADAGDDPSKTFADQDARRVVLRVVNKGLTPATEYRYESWIEVLPDTSGDFTADADHFKCDVISVLYPDAPRRINVPLRGGVSEADFHEIRKLRKYVCVRLFVEYKDPFIPTRRCYANFGFYLLPNGLGFLDKHNGVGYEDKKS
jgi:hypothetical protein